MKREELTIRMGRDSLTIMSCEVCGALVLAVNFPEHLAAHWDRDVT